MGGNNIIYYTKTSCLQLINLTRVHFSALLWLRNNYQINVTLFNVLTRSTNLLRSKEKKNFYFIPYKAVSWQNVFEAFVFCTKNLRLFTL